MKPLRLLIALVLLAGLSAAVWYSQKHPPGPATPETKTEKVVSVEQAQLQKIQIGRPADENVTLEKAEDGKWRMTAPKPYVVDANVADSLVRDFTTLNADRVLDENNTDWKGFGLDPGKLWVEGWSKDGKHYKVTLGDDAPVGAVVYGRLEGSPRLWAIPSHVKVGLDKHANDLRDKRVLPFDSEKASRITITSGGQTLEFGKAGTNWQIVKPTPTRADNFAVDDVVRSVRDGIFEAVLDESGKASTQYSFSTPYAVFEAVDPAGTHTLTVGKAKDNTYYAKTSTYPGIFRVSNPLGDNLGKKLDDFRNKKLFDFAWSDPQKVEIKDGAVQVTVEKKDNKWLSTGAGNKELTADKVQALIDHLRNLAAKGFPSNDAAAQAKYGLKQPVFEARVTSDEGKRVEKVLLAAGPEGKYYAARENEAPTYEIDKSAYDELHKAVEGLK